MKGSLQSELSQIRGIGPASATALLNEFRSLAGIRNATKEELARIIGPARAAIIQEYFSRKSG